MRLNQALAILLCTVAGSTHCLSDAAAKVTRLEFTAKAPYGSFKPGEYVRWDARVEGELSPTAERIPDLDKASRNPRGMVDYATRLTLLMPADPERGNGALLLEVPNRGRAISLSLYNSPRNVVVPVGSFDPGTGFLQDSGYTIAVVAWELGYGVELPTFADADGKRQFIEGAAFAIIRDVADFLARSSTDGAGTRNPLAGAISRTIALGYSQTGRFLKSFLLKGFNTSEGQRLFSGMHILGAAAGQITLRSIPGPGSRAGESPTFADPEVRGINEEPLATSEILEQMTMRGEILPRIVFVHTTTDYFTLRASLSRTGATEAQDRPLPASVRVYDVAGASHTFISGSGQCKFPFAILDWHPVMRATLVALDRWVSANTPPPPSQLMSLRVAGEDSMALRAPAHLPKAVIQVPNLDEDGNAIGGIRLPDMVAPLGTHGGQNPPLSFGCSLGAAYVAFAKTKQEREAANDSRLSLAERYKDRNDYVNRIRGAALALERSGLLLGEDAAIIVNAAAETTFPK
jgi:hypothetical protein